MARTIINTCKTCGGKGYLIKAVKVGGGFARQDDVCPKCKGKPSASGKRAA